VAQINLRLPTPFQQGVNYVQLTISVTLATLVFPNLWQADIQTTYFYVPGSGRPGSE